MRNLGKSFGYSFHPGDKPNTMRAKVTCSVKVGDRKATDVIVVESSGDEDFENAAIKAASSRIRPSLYDFSVVTDFCRSGVKSELKN